MLKLTASAALLGFSGGDRYNDLEWKKIAKAAGYI
jgi:hypothetical protein